MTERPVLSLAELEAFDAGAPAGARRRFCCPLCGQGKPRDSAHRCLSVETASGLWTCFRCGESGKLRDNWEEKPLARSRRISHAAKRAFALKEAGQERPEISLVQGASEPVGEGTRGEVLRQALRSLRPLEGTRGEAYLGARGLPLSVCLGARVKFSPSWMGRPAAVFPLYDEAGVLVAAQGRYTDEKGNPKARTIGPKKEGVFLSGRFWEQVKRGAPVIVTEAPIDALSLAACGFPALALCGKSGWPSWLPVRCAFEDVALAFDADEAGDEGASKLTPVLESLGARVRRLVPEGFKDWNEMLLGTSTREMGDWVALRLLTPRS